MKLNALSTLTGPPGPTERMPLLFLGHGSPMNAIEDNEFSRGWQAIARSIPEPAAILCISAHWETRGTFVTAVEKPRTIHDFRGFPRELFDVQYPAPGSPDLAGKTKAIITGTEVGLDQTWGLDHGCWSVLRHLFPAADVPVVQMSIDSGRDAQSHYELARELAALRERGVLIVGSGNMVHNLGMIDWENPQGAFDWAAEAGALLKQLISEGDHGRIVRYDALGPAMRLAVPTPEHYIPLLYVLGLKAAGESVSFFNDRTVMGSISMTSVRVG